MCGAIKAIIDQLSKWPIVIVSSLIFLLFLIVFLPAQKARFAAYANGAGSIDTSFFPTPDRVYPIAEDYGRDGRSQYIRDRLTFDIIWPLSYTLFFVSTIGFCLGRVHRDRQAVYVLCAASFLPFILDILENSMAIAIMLNYPSRLLVIPWILAVTTLLKWVFVGVTGSIFVYGILALAITELKKHFN